MYYNPILLLTILGMASIIHFNRNILLGYILITINLFAFKYFPSDIISFSAIKINLYDPISTIYIFILMTLWPVSLYFAEFYNDKIDRTEKHLISSAIVIAIMLGGSQNYLTLFIFYEILSVITLFFMNYSQKLYKTTKEYIILVIIPGFLLSLPIIFYYNDSITDFENLKVSNHFILFVIIFASKAAVLPMSRWILTAMEAPHYISALLHSTLVVKAGLIFILRVLTNYDIPYSHTLLTIYDMIKSEHIYLLPTITIIIFSCIAILSSQYKRILASSTIIHISQMILLYPNAALGYYIAMHSILKFTLFAYLGYVYIKTSDYNRFHLSDPNKYEKVFMYLAIVGILFLSGTSILHGITIKHKVFAEFNRNLYFLITTMGYIYNIKLIKGIIREKAEIIFIAIILTFAYQMLFLYLTLFAAAIIIEESISRRTTIFTFAFLITINEL